MATSIINKSDEYLAKTQPIVEISTVLQGEGPLTGIPHFLIRTTGCKLRCCWGDTPCDTWYTSHSPEKGQFSLNNLIDIIKANPQIKHAFVTGGAPTMHNALLLDILRIFSSFSIVSTLETEGSVEFVSDYNLHFDYVSLSPKLRSSTPTPGTYVSQLQRELTEKDKVLHEKSRLNFTAMRSLLQSSTKKSYVKFVISDIEDLNEVWSTMTELNLKPSDVWLMPMGITNDQLASTRIWLSEICIEKGFNYTDRMHIIIHGDKRGV